MTTGWDAGIGGKVITAIMVVVGMSLWGGVMRTEKYVSVKGPRIVVFEGIKKFA